MSDRERMELNDDFLEDVNGGISFFGSRTEKTGGMKDQTTFKITTPQGTAGGTGKPSSILNAAKDKGGTLSAGGSTWA